MKMVEKISKIVWLLAGVLVVAVIALTICIGVDVKKTTMDMRTIASEVTIEDMREVLNLIEKDLDRKILALELEKQRSDSPLEWSDSNWKNYLDFCEEFGYSVIDYTWQEYRYGRLVP